MGPSLADRLNGHAKPEELTTREARQLGWTISRRTVPITAAGDDARGHVWLASRERAGIDPLSRTFVTCRDALAWIARVERGEIWR